MKHILFVTYGGGHVNYILPIVKRLREEGGLQISILGLTSARDKIEAAGFACLGFRDFLLPEDKSALKRGEVLAKDLDRSTIPYDESVAYLGLSYEELIHQAGEESAKSQYESVGRRAFLPVKTLERILLQTRPDLVFTTNSPRAEKASVLAAKQLGIPSIGCIDTQFFEKNWVVDHGDRICVLSSSVCDELVKLGRDPKTIAITGNPDFDALAAPDLDEKANEFRKAKGWEGKKVVLWASQWSGREDIPAKNAIDAELVRISKNHDDWAMCVRFHPNEDSREKFFPSEWTISTPQDDLAVLLKSIDVTIVFSTTVGLQAALLKKSIIAFLNTSVKDYSRHDQVGLGIGCWKVEDLESCITKALAMGTTVTTMLPPLGKATEANINVIKELLHTL